MSDELEDLRWHTPALETATLFGLAKEDVEAIVRNPHNVTVDPSSAVREWRTERRTTGDVTVVLTYPEYQPPLIWGVYLALDGPTQQTRSAGGGGGSNVPRTLANLRKRIVAAGLVIKVGGRHDLVTTKDDVYVASIPRTPSDHRSVPNAWAQIRKKGYDV